MRYNTILLFLSLWMISCSNTNNRNNRIITASETKRHHLINDSLSDLHIKLSPPKEGDWLSSHPEKGETFEQYVQKWPKTADDNRTKLYLVQLSSFDSVQREIFNLTKDYLSIFYNTEVEEMILQVDYNAIPEKFYRKNDLEEVQVLTDFFLKQKLLKELPEDAWGMIGCTTVDIYPDPKWNFVFGQASLNNRVGVWSMRRLGDPINYPEITDRAFMRNLKIASHETGHMLSMKHCIYYDCLMNGSAHILENDAKPPYFCPICLSKADWNRHFDLTKRNNELFKFWSEHEISIYHQYYEIIKDIDL
ncbi:MAG: hypothetical protein H6600_07765 [Flavobacteriales bacterium]|nr:hypothetical protein [Flavobacteriales bacterium]MCB9198339.1 hypothetical protein [Flavobacteriales bacterium]